MTHHARFDWLVWLLAKLFYWGLPMVLGAFIVLCIHNMSADWGEEAVSSLCADISGPCRSPPIESLPPLLIDHPGAKRPREANGETLDRRSNG